MVLNLLYLLTLLAASPFLLYRSLRYKKYRDGWGEKFFGAAPQLPPIEPGRERIWFHAVSVGEVNLLLPIVAEMDATRQNWEFVVSSTSKTGYELAKKLFATRATIFYCPLDFTWAVKRTLRRIAPTALVLVELELWPNLIAAAKRFGVHTAIVNGRIGDHSFRSYHRIRRFLAPTFRRIDLIVAQDEVAAAYFRQLTPDHQNIVVSGSIKFDGVQTDRENAKTRALADLVGVNSNDVVYLCGSTQAPEELGAIETYRRLYREFPNLKLFIAPRHKERFDEVAKALAASEFAWTRRSTLPAPGTPVKTQFENPAQDARRVVLIDSLGELGYWWGIAKIAFVGGSWGNRGGQNMLEPSAYGAAVSFGSNTRNFRAIVETLLREEAAQVVSNVDEATAFVRRCLVDPVFRETLGKTARQIVVRNSGATKRTLNELSKLFENIPSYN